MWSLIVTIAAARPPEQVDLRRTVELPATAEPSPFGWSDQWSRETFTIGPVRGRDDPGTATDDGKMRMGCRLVDRTLVVEVSVQPSNYPEHLPEELSCVVGRYRLTAEIVPIRARYVDPAELRMDPATGGEVRRYAVEPGQTSVQNTVLVLPADLDLPPQRAEAALDGERWADTTCEVPAADPRLLVVRVTERARDGSGSCTLTDATGRAHTLPIRLVSLPKAVVPLPRP